MNILVKAAFLLTYTLILTTFSPFYNGSSTFVGGDVSNLESRL